MTSDSKILSIFPIYCIFPFDCVFASVFLKGYLCFDPDLHECNVKCTHANGVVTSAYHHACSPSLHWQVGKS